MPRGSSSPALRKTASSLLFEQGPACYAIPRDVSFHGWPPGRSGAGAEEELPQIERTLTDRDPGSPQALREQLERVRWRGSVRL